MSTAINRMSRLLALVPWLQAHDGITVTQAAEHFHVTPEQLERDLWLLVVCGIPGYGPDQLIDIDFWDDGHIHVRDPLTLDAPMRLSAEEATALMIALDALDQLPGSPPSVTSAKLKLLEVLGGEQDVVMDITGLPQDHLHSVLTAAIADARSVHLTYASGTTGEITQRLVVPEKIESMTGRHLLHGYCDRSQARRSFRLDRIVDISLGEPAAVPIGDVLVPHEPVQVHCALTPNAEWVADVHPVERLGTLDDGRRTVRISVYDPQWIIGLAMSLGGDLEVLEPVDIRDLVAQETRLALTAYARGLK
jgi:proteasome accessory factor C